MWKAVPGPDSGYVLNFDSSVLESTTIFYKNICVTPALVMPDDTKANNDTKS